MKSESAVQVNGEENVTQLLSISVPVQQLCTSLQLIVQPSSCQAAVLQRQHPLQVSLASRFLSATQPHHVPDFYIQPHAGVLP